MLAARHPADVGKLMMVDSLPFFAATMAPPGTAVTVTMVEPRAAQMRDAVAASYGRTPDRTAAAAQVTGMALNASYHPRLIEWAMASDPRVAARAMYEDLTTDMRPGCRRCALRSRSSMLGTKPILGKSARKPSSASNSPEQQISTSRALAPLPIS